MKIRIVLGCLIVFIATAVTARSQQVVYVCPEGTYETSFFGYRECKSLTDEPSRPANQKSQALTAAETTLGLAMIGSKTLDNAARVLKDPRNKNYENGQWLFDEPKTGEFCSASFLRRDVGVMVLGPGGGIPGAFLIFFGPQVPKSKEIAKIKVTLTQTGGDPPQTVQALNFTHPTMQDYGTIVFAVPSFEAALAGTEDVHKFGVSVQGKSVIDVEWNGGFAARDKLKQCAAQRAKK